MIAGSKVVVRTIADNDIFDDDIIGVIAKAVYTDTGVPAAFDVVIFDTIVGIIHINARIIRTGTGVIPDAGVADYLTTRCINVNTAQIVALNHTVRHSPWININSAISIVDSTTISHSAIYSINSNVSVVTGVTIRYLAVIGIDAIGAIIIRNAISRENRADNRTNPIICTVRNSQVLQYKVVPPRRNPTRLTSHSAR